MGELNGPESLRHVSWTRAHSSAPADQPEDPFAQTQIKRVSFPPPMARQGDDISDSSASSSTTVTAREDTIVAAKPTDAAAATSSSSSTRSLCPQEPLSSRLRRLVESDLGLRVFPFATDEEEARFATFIFAPTLLPQAATLVVIGVIHGVVVPFITTTPENPIVAFGLEAQSLGQAICGVIALLAAVIAAVSHFKHVGRVPRYVELWWIAVCLTWMLGNLVLTSRRLTHTCRASAFLPSTFNTTAAISLCRGRVIDGWNWCAIGTLLIGAPRVYLSAWLVATHVIGNFVFRWAFDGRVDFLPGEGPLLWFLLVFLVLMCLRETSQRERFEKHRELLSKMSSTEKARQAAETIMSNILSASVMDRLVRKEAIMDTAPSASVLFSDIAGFTSWSSSRSAMDIVKMLNAMYRNIDGDLLPYRVEKVTTIGDAYWATCGIPTPCDMPTLRLVAFGLQMQRQVAEMRRRSHLFCDIRIRVGIATGRVSGGIVGTRQLAYQVFGPVNERAEHMEQIAPVGGVLACSATLHATRHDLSFEGMREEDLRTSPGPTADCAVVLDVPWRPAEAVALSVSGSLQHLSVSGSARSGRSTSRMSNAELNGRRAVLLANRRRAAAANADDDGPGGRGNVDLSALREQLASKAHVVRLNFADPTTEAAYTLYALEWHRGPLVSGAASLLLASWFAIAVIIAANESGVADMLASGQPAQPWHVFVIYLVLMGLNVLNGSFIGRRHVHPYASWALLAVSSALLCVASATMRRESMLNREGFYMCIIGGFLLSSVGAPAMSYVTGTAFGFIAILGPWWLCMLFLKSLGTNYLLNASLGFAGCWVIGLRCLERDLRSQFLDERVAIVADGEITEQRLDIEELLAKSVPSFVLNELTDWLGTDRVSSISRQHSLAAIMFLRVPAVAAQLHDSTADPSDVLRAATALVSLYDEAVDAAGVGASCTKIKTIGDIILVAAGLQRQQPRPALRPATDGTNPTPPKTQPVYNDGGVDDYHQFFVEELSNLVLLASKIQRCVADQLSHGITAGIHQGPVAAGVLGDERLVFDVFGDTVNTASRLMSSAAEPGIYVSCDVAQGLARMNAETSSPSPGDAHHQPHHTGDGAPPIPPLHSVLVTLGPAMPRPMKGKGIVNVYQLESVVEVLHTTHQS